MRKIIFLGYVVPPDCGADMSGISVAGNKMQWNVIKHLSEFKDFDIDCITITPKAVFPKDKAIRQKREETELLPGVSQVRVSYWNLPIIKQLSQIRSMYREAKKVAKKNPDAIVLCFNLFPQVGVPMRKLQKKFPNLKTVCLLADLPIDDNTKRKGFSKLLRKRFDKSTWKSMSLCQKYIVLNEYVAKTYLNGQEYIVVDGGVDETQITPYAKREKKEKNMLFCGALTEYNGVLTIMKAMEYIQDQSVVLDIYGGGYLQDEIAKIAKENNRIRFHGRIPNDEVMKKQREAWLLVNPRPVDDLIAKVTFPSKTFEYLLSGTPVLTTRLNGYGREYEDKMFFAENDTAQGLGEAAQKIANISQHMLDDMTERAYEFITTERTWRAQAKRINDFLKKV